MRDKFFSPGSPIFLPSLKPASTNSNSSRIKDPLENHLADVASSLSLVVYLSWACYLIALYIRLFGVVECCLPAIEIGSATTLLCFHMTDLNLIAQLLDIALTTSRKTVSWQQISGSNVNWSMDTFLASVIVTKGKQNSVGLMVSALESGSSGLGFESRPRTLCCVLGQEILYSHSASPTQAYKWVLTNLMLGLALRWTRNISTCSMLQKPG